MNSERPLGSKHRSGWGQGDKWEAEQTRKRREEGKGLSGEAWPGLEGSNGTPSGFREGQLDVASPTCPCKSGTFSSSKGRGKTLVNFHFLRRGKKGLMLSILTPSLHKGELRAPKPSWVTGGSTSRGRKDKISLSLTMTENDGSLFHSYNPDFHL